MLTLEQQKIEAELTAARAEAIGWPKGNVDFFRSTPEMYQEPNQITFYEFGHNQDLDNNVVSNFFRLRKRKGRFLLIGAANGIDQTYSLLQKGWSGVYCEPDPFALSSIDGNGLLRAMKHVRDRTIIVNAAITPAGGICEFYINPTIALSTAKKQLSVDNSIPIVINTIGVNQLLDYVGEDFDYVQIDAEGFDTELIASIDWSKRLLNCKLIGAELGMEPWRQMLAHGYIVSHVTEHNTYFRRLDIDE